jgi:hypothetical protein
MEKPLKMCMPNSRQASFRLVGSVNTLNAPAAANYEPFPCLDACDEPFWLEN